MDVTVSNVEYKTDTLLSSLACRVTTMYQNLEDEAIHMGKSSYITTWSSVLALHAPVTTSYTTSILRQEFRLAIP
jgi:hypothetical protein